MWLEEDFSSTSSQCQYLTETSLLYNKQHHAAPCAERAARGPAAEHHHALRANIRQPRQELPQLLARRVLLQPLSGDRQRGAAEEPGRDGAAPHHCLLSKSRHGELTAAFTVGC